MQAEGNAMLTTDDLVDLVRRVFVPRPDDTRLALLCDLPDAASPDNADWAARRATAADWAQRLDGAAARLGLAGASLLLYRNVRRPNNDLPERAWIHRGGELPVDADALAGEGEPLEALLRAHSIVIAPTEFSATAPLKLLGPRYGCRAATMPGFSDRMMPAMRLDWTEIDARCRALKARLDAAAAAHFVFTAGGREETLVLDLRGRTAHASGGLIPNPGTAGNLPSGESYIVPYEGERAGDPSRSAGIAPLELEGELLAYRIEGNRVVEVLGDGPAAARERAELAAEWAYGNVAELGLGILADYGIKPIGELLLDEKLGLHIAFGRSDHFGGQVGAKDWIDRARMCHIDRVYIPEVMPRVRVVAVDLEQDDGTRVPLLRDHRYV